MREQILKTKGLRKKYKKAFALDGIDLTVGRGDIYGIIGRNGAGKTTLLKIVSGLIPSYEGEYEIFGKSSDEALSSKVRMGCLIDAPAFFPELSAYQNLKYYCMQKGITDESKIEEVLNLLSLDPKAKKKYKAFSQGMKQRLGIAFALMDSPELVLLDEPINGLDPMGISELRDLILKLNHERNITFVISSHILSELYSTANRFLIIDQGKVVKDITKEELDKECRRGVNITCDDVAAASVIIEREMGITDFIISDEKSLNIFAQIDPSEVTRCLISNNINVSGVSDTGISLEEYFKKIVGALYDQ